MTLNELRLGLNRWWEGLSVAQKKAVPISRNKIDLRYFFIDAEIDYFKLRKHLKEDICEIEKELKELRILLNDDEVIATLMSDFIYECKVNPDFLWDIELKF